MKQLSLGRQAVQAIAWLTISFASNPTPPAHMSTPVVPGATPARNCGGAVDYQDPTYGASVRWLRKPVGQEHGLYYHRNPWNADGSAMVAVWKDLSGRNWQVVLLDGSGCYLKTLFPITQYDWRLVWDRADPNILYTFWNDWSAELSSELYRYDVTTQTATLVKTFPVSMKPTGPSINQDNTKMLVVTTELVPVLRVLRMSDWTELATFTITTNGTLFPGTTACVTDWDDQRFTGFQDFIVAFCRSFTTSEKVVRIFNADGTLHHEFNGPQYNGGHTDFSPDGRWAYYELPSTPSPPSPAATVEGTEDPSAEAEPLRIHVVNIDGTNDTVVYSAPYEQAQWVHNLHLSWPDRVADYFFVSFFPLLMRPAPPGASPVDEVMLVYSSGPAVPLARTYGSAKPFWTQGLAAPNADGTAVAFSSNRCPIPGTPCTGTIDLHLVEVPAALQVPPPPE